MRKRIEFGRHTSGRSGPGIAPTPRLSRQISTRPTWESAARNPYLRGIAPIRAERAALSISPYPALVSEYQEKPAALNPAHLAPDFTHCGRYRPRFWRPNYAQAAAGPDVSLSSGLGRD